MSNLFSYRSRRKKRGGGNLLRLMLPSLLGLVLCMVCLAGTTLAWFSVASTAGVADMHSGTFTLRLSVPDVDGFPKDITSDNDYEVEVEFSENESYQITLTNTGSAKRQGGYCEIIVDETRYRTATFQDAFTFTLQTGASETAGDGELGTGEVVKVTFMAKWGNPSLVGTFSLLSGDEPILIEDGDTIGNAPVVAYKIAMELTNITAVRDESGDDLVVILTPDEGYALPERITVTIGDQTYTVSTAPGEKIFGDGSVPTFADSTLTIPSALIDGDVTISGAGVAAKAAPEPADPAKTPVPGQTTEQTTPPSGTPTPGPTQTPGPTVNPDPEEPTETQTGSDGT